MAVLNERIGEEENGLTYEMTLLALQDRRVSITPALSSVEDRQWSRIVKTSYTGRSPLSLYEMQHAVDNCDWQSIMQAFISNNVFMVIGGWKM